MGQLEGPGWGVRLGQNTTVAGARAKTKQFLLDIPEMDL